MKERSAPRIEPCPHQAGEIGKGALGALDLGEAGRTRNLGRARADGIDGKRAAGLPLGEGAHAIGRGEDERLHPIEGKLDRRQRPDLEERVDERGDAALGQEGGERLRFLEGARDEDPHRQALPRPELEEKGKERGAIALGSP